MASKSGRGLIKIRPQDVSRFRSAYVRASNLLEDARESLSSRALDQMAERILPKIPEVGENYEEWLQSNTLTREDYNRHMAYLERIVKASKATPPSDTTQITYYGTLTSIADDEVTGEYEGAFLRRETAMRKSQARLKVERELKRRGIKTMRVPVMIPDPKTGEVKRMYDRNRHLVTITVPATPENREKYREAINKNSSLELPTPDLPEGAHVEMFGDMVPVKRAKTHVASPEALLRGLSDDLESDVRNRGYFYNYGAIVDTTLPDEISDEINGYIDKINELSPKERARVYTFISDSPEDAGTIEYLYLDRSGSTSSKVKRILKFWREEVAPLIDAEAPKESIALSDVRVKLEEAGYRGGGAQSVYDEYQAAKQKGTNISITFDEIKRLMKSAR